jgi:hypothetical protein
MNDAATLRPTPTLPAVLGAQLRLMARTHWIAAGLVALLLAVMMGVFGRIEALGQLSSPATLTVCLGLVWQPLTIVLFFWPLLVTWRGETPSQRGYHWSLPVRRPLHQLARLAAGWAWLVTAVVAGIFVGWIVAAAIAGGLSFGSPGVLVAALLSLSALYGLGAVFALLSDHPLWWILGTWAGLSALTVLAHARDWSVIEVWIESILNTGSISLSVATSAPAVLAGVSGGGEAAARPWAAVLLWTGIALAAVTTAAFIRQERSAGAG